MADEEVGDVMNEVIKFPAETPETRAAIKWAARLDRGNLKKAEKAELENWLAGNKARQEELIRVVEMWDEWRARLANSEIDAGDYFASELSELSESRLKHERRSKFRRVAAIAASFGLVFATASIGVKQYQYTQYTSKNTTYATLIGEQRTIMLPDNSTVVLNTSSKLTVNYRKGAREISLLKGEAHFEVAHDKTRPFLVQAGGGVVRAVGTAFSVKFEQSEIEVLVSDGEVLVGLLASNEEKNTEIREVALPQEGTAKASVGERVTFGDTINTVTRVEPTRLENELFWRNGVLAFDDEPLHQVIAEISRYTDLEIDIVDADVRDLRVGGYFPIARLDSIFDSLRDGFGLSVQEVDDGVFHISRHQG
ncbi:FecR family protein [Hyphococcus lacteus]|uniref:FecR domain-containing protein n=1 Tax=Hyphococcus lacteus TaxID=3143536 RepID=A0ABV3Z8I9_9PROT